MAERKDDEVIPTFQPNGLLPQGDYEVSFEELQSSVLVNGPSGSPDQGAWDRGWRRHLVDNLEVLTKQLWQVGIRDVLQTGRLPRTKIIQTISMGISSAGSRSWLQVN
jgi:hypothetical protein